MPFTLNAYDCYNQVGSVFSFQDTRDKETGAENYIPFVGPQFGYYGRPGKPGTHFSTAKEYRW